MRSEVQIFPDPPESSSSPDPRDLCTWSTRRRDDRTTCRILEPGSGRVGVGSCALTRQVKGGHSSAGRAPALHAGGRRFDPVWLHQFASGCCVENQIGVVHWFDADLVFESSFFNNLEISDVLTGSGGLTQIKLNRLIQFKCRICTSHDTVQHSC